MFCLVTLTFALAWTVLVGLWGVTVGGRWQVTARVMSLVTIVIKTQSFTIHPVAALLELVAMFWDQTSHHSHLFIIIIKPCHTVV